MKDLIDTIKHEIEKMRALGVGSVQLNIETVKALLEAYEEQGVDLEVYRLNHTALLAHAAKLEAELDAARDANYDWWSMRHG